MRGRRPQLTTAAAHRSPLKTNRTRSLTLSPSSSFLYLARSFAHSLSLSIALTLPRRAPPTARAIFFPPRDTAILYRAVQNDDGGGGTSDDHRRRCFSRARNVRVRFFPGSSHYERPNSSKTNKSIDKQPSKTPFLAFTIPTLTVVFDH